MIIKASMYIVEFSEEAIIDLKSIQTNIRTRIIKKIEYYSLLENPISTAKRMVSSELGERRWRILDRRVIFDIDEHGKIIIIQVVGHRSDIYT